MTASSNFWLQDIPQQLAALDAAALRRTRRTVAPLQGARILVDGSPCCSSAATTIWGWPSTRP